LYIEDVSNVKKLKWFNNSPYGKNLNNGSFLKYL
jgi:hypothetical protein